MVCVTVNGTDDGSAAIATVTDNHSNTYTAVDTTTTGASFRSSTFYALSFPGGLPTTITATFSTGTSDYPAILVDEFSGVAASAALDGHNQQIQASASGTDALSSNTFSTSANGDLIWGIAAIPNATGASAGTGLTAEQSLVSAYYTEFKIQSSSGSVAATFTPTGTSTASITSAMAFKHQ